MTRIVSVRQPPSPKCLCKSCGGSGWRLRPSPEKLLNFTVCTTCRGYGVRWRAQPKDRPE